MLSAEAVNPCFVPLDETTIKVALWRAVFKFPLVLKADEPFIVGVREPSKIANIQNSGDIETGMIVEFVAKGEVSNPNFIVRSISLIFGLVTRFCDFLARVSTPFLHHFSLF